ncbi:hypothetical protein KC207_13450 [Phycicoccus sp. BSK3Z-2]|uniref:DUF2795 domain-containing protein n=1 Tax=Phycicoccus avicenniae TaxID=2828860 RepID=A0A941D8Z6_9MICO|nr:hypothetical protein [Phycicoccus avicenniae]MBR7744294.1 hypothetical protein [Phycicoccus avicenniae]
MTTVGHVEGMAADDADPRLADDLTDLRRALADHPFPTLQDDLIAACLSRGEPSRLACRLSRLSRTRVYTSLDEVCAEIELAATTG